MPETDTENNKTHQIFIKNTETKNNKHSICKMNIMNNLL